MTDEQMKLLVALVGNQDMQVACDAAGISRATAYRWVKEPEFQAELKRLRDEVLSEALAKMKTHVTRAVTELASLVDAEDERVRRLACNDILHHALKVRELEDLEQRLVALEKGLAEQRKEMKS